jgi:hypothetical protein
MIREECCTIVVERRRRQWCNSCSFLDALRRQDLARILLDYIRVAAGAVGVGVAAGNIGTAVVAQAYMFVTNNRQFAQGIVVLVQRSRKVNCGSWYLVQLRQ